MPQDQQQQQTGMLFIKTQQVQPALIIAVMQAQHAWIIAELDGSPLVHVMQTPSSVVSHLQWHMVILNEQTVIPFMMLQQLQRPPAIMAQRFWSIPAETLSSQAQTIFIPPLHFSNVIVQRGTIIMFAPVGAAAVVPITPVGPVMLTPAIPNPARSIIAVVMPSTP
jgi:hypothetical protein